MHVLEPILRNWTRHPFRVWAEDDFRRWRGVTMWAASRHLARAIEDRTTRPNIGVLLPTGGAFPVSLAAIWMLGRTVVPLNYLLSKEEIAWIIEHAELDLVVTASAMLEKFGPLPDSVQSLALDEQQFRGVPSLFRPMKRADEHVAVMLYTSGTSGRPKGVQLTVANLATNVDQCIRWVNFTKRDCFLGVLPQFHSFGFTVTTLLPLILGCTVVYTARFQVSRVLELLRRRRPTALMAIPSMYNALLHSKAAKPEDLASLKYIVSGGEPLPDAVYDGFAERFGIRICEGYGLTETAPVTNWVRPQEERRGVVGRPLDGVEEVIIDPESGEQLDAGRDGEIRIRGGNIMAGYYKDAEATSAAFDDNGFFRTGDMGRISEDGFLSITGRIKEMLIIGGENVFPREIEDVIRQHPAVLDAAVIGMADSMRGEVPLAFVELIEGVQADPVEIRQFCRGSLSGFKVPREVRIVEALPRNPTGKIQRRRLSADTPGREEPTHAES
ncbi:MAG: AMP-binding protein [Phycisphaerales bacterium]|nr:AMP-binding protein [Phycisphaerales bacterium]MDP7086548.1 AMP-binding protein [Phycisphaerales bacterium]MDP7519803.1 AMP-binding protein [Phycisphaerales bacterium]HJN80982.1 AMP-binding protein [Phycisphaerales bacterium]